MAITIKQLLDFAWMSQASYLDFSGFTDLTSEEVIKERLKAGRINTGNNFADKARQSKAKQATKQGVRS